MSLVYLMIASQLLCLSSVNCLDSPAKIQRNRQQQQASNNSSSPQVVELSSTGTSYINNNHDSLSTITTNRTSVERVRRTNSEQQQQQQQPRQVASSGSSQQAAGRHEGHECPPSRVYLSLLPPEYSGSPAQTQRPTSMARAHCDCQPDALGWHLTCYPSSSLFPAPPAGSSGRAPNPAMPNQLHPAFRAPQMARHQQQVAAAASRRNRRWLAPNEDGDDGAINRAGDLYSSSEAETISPHDGFGEETSGVSATSASAATTTSTPKPNQQAIKLANNNATQFHKRRQQQQQQHQTSDNNDEIILLPGDNVHNYSEIRSNTGNNSSSQSSRQRQEQSDKLTFAASSNHLTFQTAPTLFSIRYVQNNMIEIDCDQAAPQYKAAMFQGKFPVWLCYFSLFAFD